MPPTHPGAETETSVRPAPAGVVATVADPPAPARDVAVGLFILVWACVGWIALPGSPRLFDDTGLDPGPALLPLVVLTTLSVGGLAILVTGIVGLLRAAPRTETPHAPLAMRLHPHLVPAALLATLAAYPSVMQGIGYTAATAIFVLGWILALTAWRHLPDRNARVLAAVVALGAAAAVVALLYASFVVVIHAPLP